MKRIIFRWAAALGLVASMLGGCITGANSESEGDADDETVGEAALAQKADPVDRTGTSCDIELCNGLLYPYGKCVDATCSRCVGGGHSAPGDGEKEYCGPFVIGFTPGSGSSSSTGGGVYAP